MIATHGIRTEMEDQELAVRVSTGDHAAFTLLFERHKSSVYRFALLMTGNQATAEDIYQDVFLNFYRICRTGQAMHNVKGYLTTSARRSALNAIKLSRRNVPIESIEEISWQPDPEVDDTNIHLRQALMAIPPQYREAFLLAEYEGYSYEEIAEQLEVTREVVKNRIYRAKRALQKLLGPLLRND